MPGGMLNISCRATGFENPRSGCSGHLHSDEWMPALRWLQADRHRMFLGLHNRSLWEWPLPQLLPCLQVVCWWQSCYPDIRRRIQHCAVYCPQFRKWFVLRIHRVADTNSFVYLLTSFFLIWLLYAARKIYQVRRIEGLGITNDTGRWKWIRKRQLMRKIWLQYRGAWKNPYARKGQLDTEDFPQ